MFATRGRARVPLLGLLGLALLAAAPTQAVANGRPPSSVDIHFRPGHPQDVLAGMTFGLIQSHDGGATWSSWVCEAVLHYGGQYDPTYAYSASGAIFASSYNGLVVNRGGCTFDATALGKLFVGTLELASDGALYVAVSDPTDAKIYKSTDDGLTFTSGSPGLAGDWWQSLAAAPSQPGRLYLAGFRISGQAKTLLLFRSDDGGATFAPLAVGGFTASHNSVLSVAGVSPTNPDVVFIRVSYATGVIGDTVYRSADAGATWTKVLEVGDALPGFVIRTDGTILAGTKVSGSYRSTDLGLTFQPLTTSLQVGCLVETPDHAKVWACAQNYGPDNMSIASSADGASWTKVFKFEELAAPLDCPAGTDQHDTCVATIWCGLRQQLGITSTVIACAGPVDGPAPDAAKPPPPTKPGGCCDTSGQPSGLMLAGLVALVLARRRR
jgi:uncharacterized protein (TIGR03382 family)